MGLTMDMRVNSCLCRIAANSMADVIQMLSFSVANDARQDLSTIRSHLKEFSKDASLVEHSGTVLIEGRIDGLKEPYVGVATLENPVVDAHIDTHAFQKVVLFCSPKDAGIEHVHKLSSLMRVFKDDEFSKLLLSANTSHDLIEMCNQTDLVRKAA